MQRNIYCIRCHNRNSCKSNRRSSIYNSLQELRPLSVLCSERGIPRATAGTEKWPGVDAKKIRQILLLLDSEQTGEQSAALDKLRALKAQGEPVFREVFDMFEHVAKIAEERDKLAARFKAGRWFTFKSHVRTAAISSAFVGVIAGGLYLANYEQRGGLIAGAKVTACKTDQSNFDRDQALRELRACNQSRPSPPSRPAKDRRQ